MSHPQSSATPSKVLVVEDDPSISDVVSTALRYQGHSVTQTGNDQPSDRLRVGDLELDPSSQEVRRGHTVIDLSPTEFRLLHYLLNNAGIVVSKAQILVNVWDYDFDGSENVVELYVGYLRRKIDDGHAPLIHTKRGAGYILRSLDS